MNERHFVSSANVTPEERNSLPNVDHTTLFSYDEVLAALRQLVAPDVATAIADELYGDAREPGVFFYGELLTALSNVSESAAERVRTIIAPHPEIG